MNVQVASSKGFEVATSLELQRDKDGLVESSEVTKFETSRWVYTLAMPFLWILVAWVATKKAILSEIDKPEPHTNTFWFDGLGSGCREVKEGAASWKALEVIYNRPFGKDKTVGGLVDDFWNGSINSKAIRNRLKLAKKEVRSAILQFSGQEEVRILSLAAGSAQAVIEVISELPVEVRVKALLVDIDPTALSYAKKLAKMYGVADQIETLETSVVQVRRISRDFRPHVIEMLGLLDYVRQDNAIRLVGQIRKSLEPHGVFLTCNISPNREMHFLKYVINWEMIYRSPIVLEEVIAGAGFNDYRLVYEPLKLHGIAVARRTEW